jgi:hypothetical protein
MDSAQPADREKGMEATRATLGAHVGGSATMVVAHRDGFIEDKGASAMPCSRSVFHPGPRASPAMTIAATIPSNDLSEQCNKEIGEFSWHTHLFLLSDSSSLC